MRHHIFLGMLAIATLLMRLNACAQPETARLELLEQGFYDIKIEGAGWLSCSPRDVSRTRFVATRSGNRVHGVVCTDLAGKTVVRTTPVSQGVTKVYGSDH